MAYDPFASGDFGASPFDEFLARFFGGSVPQRPVQRIDIGRLMTEQARELLRDAATQAAQWGDPDLDTDHLLLDGRPRRGQHVIVDTDGDKLAFRISG